VNYDNSLVVTITVTCDSWAPSGGDHLFTCGAIYWPPHTQGCATFITEGPNVIKQIRPRAAPSFQTGCLILVTGIKIHFVVLHLARGPQVAHPCRIL